MPRNSRAAAQHAAKVDRAIRDHKAAARDAQARDTTPPKRVTSSRTDLPAGRS